MNVAAVSILDPRLRRACAVLGRQVRKHSLGHREVMAIPRLVCSVFSFQRVTAELDRLSAMNGEKSGDEGK
eukprot:CAMPEP_0181239314 /NCGR_PEP_ID=MMETSP1096-20121128/39864_1 /TAXON_ID=156174 ORGANISM="Chrysochromulina ericina, Strain CCMP281" /NCGR_SAMPLE_ID=MMETSP1096 /ASSEMBLY_ACC=CAM_ASM_000453 /LENGTH=70 /DNA_ID=CAMNT_0023334995 /DNA_START=511 /DNA_END=723 /DNA_ORIENTATION=-